MSPKFLPNKNMNIAGLTVKQSTMLDIIWNFQTREEYEEWKETLHGDDLLLSESLLYLLIVETIDHQTDDPKNLKLFAANTVINKVRYCS